MYQKPASSAGSDTPSENGSRERRSERKKQRAEQGVSLQADDSVFSPDRHIGAALRETYRAFARTLTQNLAPLGLTLSMWFVLRRLWKVDELSQAELGRSIDLNPAALVSVLNALEAAGLINRKRTQADRRVFIVSLTAAGRKLRTKATALALRGDARAMHGIKPVEIEQVLSILKRLRSNLTEHRPGN